MIKYNECGGDKGDGKYNVIKDNVMHHTKDGFIDTSDGTYCTSFDDAIS